LSSAGDHCTSSSAKRRVRFKSTGLSTDIKGCRSVVHSSGVFSRIHGCRCPGPRADPPWRRTPVVARMPAGPRTATLVAFARVFEATPMTMRWRHVLDLMIGELLTRVVFHPSAPITSTYSGAILLASRARRPRRIPPPARSVRLQRRRPRDRRRGLTDISVCAAVSCMQSAADARSARSASLERSASRSNQDDTADTNAGSTHSCTHTPHEPLRHHPALQQAARAMRPAGR
jgi:hypothetical protein